MFFTVGLFLLTQGAVAQELPRERQHYCEARAEAAVATAEARDSGKMKTEVLYQAKAMAPMHNFPAMVDFVYGDEGRKLSSQELREKFFQSCKVEMTN